MRKWLLPMALALVLLLGWIPSISYTEDEDPVLLARTLYALCRDESYETKLAIGAVVMNRVESVWFADTLEGVLTEQMQFPTAQRYDEASLQAARAVLSGTRVLSRDALYYQIADAREPLNERYQVASVGGYRFFSQSGRL